MALSDDTPAGAVAMHDARDDVRAWEARQVELAARGDAMAFRAIVERHHGGMYSLSLRFLRQPAEAEDAVQEAFARAYCAIDRFDPSYRLSTWLYRIVLNVCRDVWKSARIRAGRVMTDSTTVTDTDALQPDALLAERRTAVRVRQALDRLRPMYREILVLKDMQELSYQEIHEITGVPITALKIRAIRGREKLRNLLGETP